MKKYIFRFLLKKLLGWKITGKIDANIKKCVIIVVPHTSSFDFFIAIFVRGALGININFVGKKELFIFPFGIYFKWMGGEPLDRTGGLNMVDSIVNTFKNKEEFRLALSPEGTRKKVESLKTGFYYIAKNAQVPIIPVSFDFKKKEVQLFSPYYTTNNMELDIKTIEKNFIGVTGKIAAYSYVPKL